MTVIIPDNTSDMLDHIPRKRKHHQTQYNKGFQPEEIYTIIKSGISYEEFVSAMDFRNPKRHQANAEHSFIQLIDSTTEYELKKNDLSKNYFIKSRYSTIDQLKQETKSLLKLKDTCITCNIVGAYWNCDTNEHGFIALERISGVTWGQYNIDEEKQIEIKHWKVLLKKMHQMHQLGIHHNDIHMENIMFNEQETDVFIVDYNLSLPYKPGRYSYYGGLEIDVDYGCALWKVLGEPKDTEIYKQLKELALQYQEQEHESFHKRLVRETINVMQKKIL